MTIIFASCVEKFVERNSSMPPPPFSPQSHVWQLEQHNWVWVTLATSPPFCPNIQVHFVAAAVGRSIYLYSPEFHAVNWCQTWPRLLGPGNLSTQTLWEGEHLDWGILSGCWVRSYFVIGQWPFIVSVIGWCLWHLNPWCTLCVHKIRAMITSNLAGMSSSKAKLFFRCLLTFSLKSYSPLHNYTCSKNKIYLEWFFLAAGQVKLCYLNLIRICDFCPKNESKTPQKRLLEHWFCNSLFVILALKLEMLLTTCRQPSYPIHLSVSALSRI